MHALASNPDSMMLSGRGVKRTCNWVCPDQRVFGGDGFTTDWAAESAGTGDLIFCGVYGGEGGEVGLHCGGETVVDGVLRGPDGVAAAADGRASEDLEGGVGWGLDLVGYLK